MFRRQVCPIPVHDYSKCLLPNISEESRRIYENYVKVRIYENYVKVRNYENYVKVSNYDN